MLPPPPSSRQASFAYSLPQPKQHRRSTSNAYSLRSTTSARPATQDQDREDGVMGSAGQGQGSRSASVDGDDDEEQRCRELEEEMDMMDGIERERGLEETLERLGFGAYHWRLLALCGFGWMSDNSALACVAVILPRVQIHFGLSSEVVGLLSATTMAGMMVGAIGWGTVSDLMGRALPFNSTLFLTAVFGIGASFSNSFLVLCVWMFLLGSAVGGSMPTDGTLFLENLPHSKQYLLTFLSIFFSLGAVLSSCISLLFLPGRSCSTVEGCDVASGENDGWKRVLLTLSLVNLVLALARWFLFRLHESPRYLVSRGREDEAVVVLRSIATFNDRELCIQPIDVSAEPAAEDKLSPPESGGESSPLPLYSSMAMLDGGDLDHGRESSRGSGMSNSLYESLGNGPPPPPRTKPIRNGSAFYTVSNMGSPVDTLGHNAFDESFARAARAERQSSELAEREDVPEDDDDDDEDDELDKERPTIRSRTSSRGPRSQAGWSIRNLPAFLADSWRGWTAQIARLFVPQWRRTVILMWIIWGCMSLAYTMFNVWLPAVLESKAEGEGDAAIRYALREMVLYAAAGTPGSVLGAWMIQTRLGRRKSLAIMTLATGLSTFVFIRVHSNLAVILSSMLISTAATAMYAVLYGMTPETFGTSIRGTACGTSAALSRLTGVAAPVLAGTLLNISPSLPVFVSAAVFCLTAACSLALPFERIAEGKVRRGAAMSH